MLLWRWHWFYSRTATLRHSSVLSKLIDRKHKNIIIQILKKAIKKQTHTYTHIIRQWFRPTSIIIANSCILLKMHPPCWSIFEYLSSNLLVNSFKMLINNRNHFETINGFTCLPNDYKIKMFNLIRINGISQTDRMEKL